uniref:Uncharacterized protein n=1 Tax=Opuntia streptacantha TaxID=393608 RepID=A0A7C9AK68_OPUST
MRTCQGYTQMRMLNLPVSKLYTKLKFLAFHVSFLSSPADIRGCIDAIVAQLAPKIWHARNVCHELRTSKCLEDSHPPVSLDMRPLTVRQQDRQSESFQRQLLLMSRLDLQL